MRSTCSKHRLAVTLFAFFALVGAALLPSSAASAVPSLPPPTFELLWEDGLVTPTEVFADNFGNVYVVNGDSPTVVRFDTQGTPTSGWGLPGIQIPGTTTGIVVDSDGFVYLTFDFKVHKYTSTGTEILAWSIPDSDPDAQGVTHPAQPGRMAIDAGDVLHVVDSSNGRIHRYATDGTLLGTITSPLPQGDVFEPHDIDIDTDGAIYVLNWLGYDGPRNVVVVQILRLGADGTLQTSWGGWDAIGDGPGEFGNVVGLAVSDGIVFVTDYRYPDQGLDGTIHRMQAFDSEGNFLVEWGRSGSAPGEFQEHLGADVDPSGEFLYVADSFNNRIQKFRIERNSPPVCDAAYPSPATLWPPNNQFTSVDILGVTDPDGDLAGVAVTSVFQDEAVGNEPDATGLGGPSIHLRAQRDGNGDGRVYHVSFTATDAADGACSGMVTVNVPKSQGKNGAAIDGGPLYDSTVAD